jgi:hypothetical protein
MAKKKSFKNATEQFLTETEEAAPISRAETTTADEQRQEKPARGKPSTTPAQQNNAQGTLYDVPMKDVPMKLDYRFVETKSKRLNLLVQPSIYAKIKAVAERRGESVNEFIHSLLEAVEG